MIVASGTNADIVNAAIEAGVEVQRSDKPSLDSLTNGVKHQGVAAFCSELEALDWRSSVAASPNSLLLVLDGVEDPRNLGACVRTAAAMSVDAIVVPRRRSASMTPAARKVASGAEEAVQVEMVSNLARELRLMKDSGLTVVGADQNAPLRALDLDESGPLALVMGGEAKGLRRLTRETCDVLVSIPMPGRDSIASLNVSVACGILLSAIIHARENSRTSQSAP